MIDSPEEVQVVMDLYGLPTYMVPGVQRYLFQKVSPGSFLRSVVENDFVGVVISADYENKDLLSQWGLMIHHHFPTRSYGSREAVEDWLIDV